MNQLIRDALCEMGHEEAVVFDGPDFDEAIIGVTEEGRVVYDFDMMVHCLRIKEGMSEIEAIEFIEYNSIRALPYVENAPIVMTKLRLEEDDHGTD